MPHARDRRPATFAALEPPATSDPIAGPFVAKEANKQSVRRFFDCFSAGDVAGAVALFHDDATFWYPTTRQTLEMPAFAAGLEWITTRLDGAIRFEIGEMVAENNRVAVQLESFAKTVEGKPLSTTSTISTSNSRTRRSSEVASTTIPPTFSARCESASAAVLRTFNAASHRGAVTHTVYGFSLYLAALATASLLPGR